MINYFNFKGKSSDEFNIAIQNVENIMIHSAAEMDAENLMIQGRDGSLLITNGNFKDVEVSYEGAIIVRYKEEIPRLARQIKGWLLSDYKMHPLFDSYDRSYFRLARLSNKIDIQDVLGKLIKAVFTFTCHPFKYSFCGQEKLEFTKAATLQNPESFASKPYIKIIGNGDITLFLNHKAFHFYGVSGYIELDSELMECYKNDSPQNNKMSGDGFPKLEVGANNISWDGNAERLEIIPRWCCL